ncbi:hypothetical protein ONS96_014749 [Cadophora gregata f. sp. sojae]|nr:hypothetical protein ONS96_014749 [Cadophora gregata f. sp. sojae]
MVNYPGFDLANPNMVRLLSEALKLYLEGNRRTTNNSALGRMDGTQRATFQRILGQMESDEEFRGIVSMVIDLRHESDREVLRAAEDLTRYVQVTESSSEEQSEDDSSEDEDTDSEDNDQDSEGPSVKVLEEDGYQIVWDPTTMSDDFAKPGIPNHAFYKIIIPLRKETEPGSGIWEDASPIKFDYLETHNAPSWESSNTLYKFNQWRNQIFRKYLGNKRRTRDPWLMSEQQRIISLLKQQLQNRDKVRARPKWNRLANAYNRELHGTIQFKGSKLVQEGVKKLPVTDYDRFAPWRTKGAIQNIIKKEGTWKHLTKPILDGAKERRRQYDAQRPDNVVASPGSQDEKELPNPDAPKTKAQVKQTNAARREARREEASSKKGQAAIVVNSSSEDYEDEDDEDDTDEDGD